MKINLYIEEDNYIKLCLVSGKKKVDCLKWQDRNDLSRFLLANLDKLLRKNGVGLDKISEWKIISEVPQKWTTYRIADIAFKTLKIGIERPRLNPRSARSASGGIQRGKLVKKNIVC